MFGKSYFEKRKAKDYGIKLKSLSYIGDNIELTMEQTADLRRSHLWSYAKDRNQVFIGAHSYMQSGGEIQANASIGRFCSIGQNVSIGQDPRNHPVYWASSSLALCPSYTSSPKKTSIGNDVWIGDGAVIFAGLKIGHGAIIGMNAVVTKNVEPYQIVAGNPARAIRFRFEESQRAALINSHWWDKDLSDLKNIDYKDIEAFAEQASALSQLAEYKKVKITESTVSMVI